MCIHTYISVCIEIQMSPILNHKEVAENTGSSLFTTNNRLEYFLGGYVFSLCGCEMLSLLTIINCANLSDLCLDPRKYFFFLFFFFTDDQKQKNFFPFEVLKVLKFRGKKKQQQETRTSCSYFSESYFHIFSIFYKFLN